MSGAALEELRDEEITKQTCPECSGEGHIRHEDAKSYSVASCVVCGGDGWISAAQLVAWRRAAAWPR